MSTKIGTLSQTNNHQIKILNMVTTAILVGIIAFIIYHLTSWYEQQPSLKSAKIIVIAESCLRHLFADLRHAFTF